ncbi:MULTISPECIES: hypothetical protein [unclassified Rhizobium]|uniref:hypothetical protein n=1 Tax=unclassified Rhizobium TaxID=2613769 RepID=UPI000ACAAEF9|nr:MULTISPECIES: hypothetical protein [unclassified Rhizobium]
MAFKPLILAAVAALLALSGCASSGAGNNTTYANYQGYRPIPDLGVSDGGGVRMSIDP